MLSAIGLCIYSGTVLYFTQQSLINYFGTAISVSVDYIYSLILTILKWSIKKISIQTPKNKKITKIRPLYFVNKRGAYSTKYRGFISLGYFGYRSGRIAF